MMLDSRTYVRDESDESGVSGIVIVACDEDGYRVTENRDTSQNWCAPFWMPESELRANVHLDGVEVVGRLDEVTFEQVVSVAESSI